MMNVFGTLVAAAILAGTIAGAAWFGLWPQRTCHSLAPFGPNDSVCIWSIERSVGG